MRAWRSAFTKRIGQASPVLVLQEDRACWFRWQAEQGWETFTDELTPEKMEHDSLCPWLREDDSAPLSVLLVLDSPLDEVERVQAVQPLTGLRGVLQRRRLYRHLQQVHPEASLYHLDAAFDPDRIAMLHHQLPSNWQDWLQRVQSQSVRFSHVISATELLVHHVSSRAELMKVPVLVDLPCGQRSRHLLIHQNVPASLRLVHSTISDQIDATRTPVESSLAVRAHSDRLEGVTQDKVPSSAEPPQPVPPVVAESETDPCPVLVQSLAHARSLLSEQAGTVMILGLATTHTGDASNARSASVLAAIADGRETALGLRQGDVQGRSAALPKRSILRRSCQRLPDKVGIARRQYRLSRHHMEAAGCLQASVEHLQWQRRYRLLYGATWACVWLAAAALLAASVHGLSSARDRALMHQEQQRLEAQHDQLSDSVRSLSDRPGYLVRLLEHIDAHRAVRPADAENVLMGVAVALEKVPSVALDHLSWVVADTSSVDQVVLGDAAQLPSRQRLWQLDDTPSPLLVELSGHVRKSLELREQQAAIEQFSAALAVVPGLSDIRVMESPVMASQSSRRPDSARSSYRVAMTMSRF